MRAREAGKGGITGQLWYTVPVERGLEELSWDCVRRWLLEQLALFRIVSRLSIGIDGGQTLVRAGHGESLSLPHIKIH